MEIVPIKTEQDYFSTLKEIEGLMTAKPNTTEGDRLDVLVTLVEAWEARNYPFDLPDPIDAIQYHMEQNGLAAKDLVPHIGSRNRVYEVPQHPSSGGGVCRDRSSPGWETANPSTA